MACRNMPLLNFCVSRVSKLAATSCAPRLRFWTPELTDNLILVNVSVLGDLCFVFGLRCFSFVFALYRLPFVVHDKERRWIENSFG